MKHTIRFTVYFSCVLKMKSKVIFINNKMFINVISFRQHDIYLINARPLHNNTNNNNTDNTTNNNTTNNNK